MEREKLEKLRLEKEKIAKQKEEQEIKERERLAEIKRKEEEERLQRAEIERIENAIKEQNEKIKSVQSFLRKDVLLRSQHLLDPYQEDAKRSHIYDGIPIVIDGGPGTGKTTTMIQRLKFLLSKEAMEEYNENLTKEQLDYLTNSDDYNYRWLFFSPTDLLLQYLRKNMREEELIANDENTRTISKFRKKVLRDYNLINPTKDGPFKLYNSSNEFRPLIINPQKTINEFEKYSIEILTKPLENASKLNTSEYSWHKYALRIKNICSKYSEITNYEKLIKLYTSLEEEELQNVKSIEKDLKDSLDKEAFKLKLYIDKDTRLTEMVKELFEKWRKEVKVVQNTEDETDILDEDDNLTYTDESFEGKLFSQIKNLLKSLSLNKIDSKIKISKKNREFCNIIDATNLNFIDLEEVGSNAWFVRNFTNLCKGIERNVLNKIPFAYKMFRKTENVDTLYDTKILSDLIKKDANKHLHPDEQNLLIGFINNLLFNIYKRSSTRFNSLKGHKYVQAYMNNVKPVIGIDEATDYSLLDYYFMISFRYYEFSTITLSGDIMQGLNSNGISDWMDLKTSFLPNIEVKSLNISYRQLPTLLDVAREMYKDDQGHFPNYTSDKEKVDGEPKPLLFISDDEDEKAEWISNRILDIYRNYDQLPSIAIFVGERINIKEFIDRINDLDMLNGIEVVDCSDNRTLQNKEMIRVFRLSEVKGMEFEAVFFYDLDQIDDNLSFDLLRRYLYVGISRATSHLAATICAESGNEEIIKYFEVEEKGW